MRVLTLRAMVMALAALAALGLVGCVSGSQTGQNSDGFLESQETVVAGWRDVQFSWLSIPEGVHTDSYPITINALSSNGQVVVGAAINSALPVVNGRDDERLDAFRWDLTSNRWQWLGGPYPNIALGVNASADIVWGSHWVWQRSGRTDLGRQFWAQAVRSDGQILGVKSGGYLVLRPLSGGNVSQWPVNEVLQLDDQGLVKEKYWFAGNGILVSTTLNSCVATADCEQALITRWTPEQGRVTVSAQIPEKDDEFIQSNPGPTTISNNGEWMAGAVGRRLYLWDMQGQVRQIGGFEHGGSVYGISDDGQVAIGSAIDRNTATGERAWIWTATEGQGGLDEWLRNHGVDVGETHDLVAVKFISADRRVMIGTAQRRTDDLTGGGISWWRAVLPEKLRVLVH